MNATLLHFHDPMCSWCWGYKPEWQRLEKALPDNIHVRYILGGLAADTDEPMPIAMQQTIAGYWKRIETELGATFNYDFWTQCQPRRSTYPACRAVIAARAQGQEQVMINAIQKAYYLRAMNPSENQTLIQIANECGLDSQQFETDLGSKKTQQTLMDEVNFARQAPIRGFPSLVLQISSQHMPVTLDYKNHTVSLASIQQILAEHQ